MGQSKDNNPQESDKEKSLDFSISFFPPKFHFNGKNNPDWVNVVVVILVLAFLLLLFNNFPSYWEILERFFE